MVPSSMRKIIMSHPRRFLIPPLTQPRLNLLFSQFTVDCLFGSSEFISIGTACPVAGDDPAIAASTCLEASARIAFLFDSPPSSLCFSFISAIIRSTSRRCSSSLYCGFNSSGLVSSIRIRRNGRSSLSFVSGSGFRVTNWYGISFAPTHKPKMPPKRSDNTLPRVRAASDLMYGPRVLIIMDTSQRQTNRFQIIMVGAALNV
ncbi:hypothetical protein V1508DRAFT_421416 [Lipomyces doorenjongii]|uniref:uncharacterized protein n=1 Tax=Lipomyces doorenjongii TaxID=383834 RepID=UPI0034CF3C6C